MNEDQMRALLSQMYHMTEEITENGEVIERAVAKNFPMEVIKTPRGIFQAMLN